MKQPRRTTCRFATLLSVFAVGVLSSHAEPRLAGGLIRFGRSPSLTSQSWAYLHYHIENPESREVRLRLSLRPAQGAETIFEKDIEIGPRAFLRGRELITAAPSETYELRLYEGDRRIAHEQIFTRFGRSGYRARLFFINDSQDYEGTGGLGQRKGLIERVDITTVNAREAPHHWLGYGDAHAVFVVRPDYSEMTSMQFSALADFVRRGGTLFFLCPEGLLATADTPLRDLLPVTPLRVRRVEQLPELDAWGVQGMELGAEGPANRQPFADPLGVPFLESIPFGEGITTIQHNEFPVCRWRRAGLGTVGMFAVDPCSRLMQDSGCYTPVWNHILAWTTTPYLLSHAQSTEILPRLLALLTGFRIPSVRVVQTLLLLYLLVVTVLLALGFALRKHTAAWIAATLVGVMWTGGIFILAFRRNAEHPPQSASILDLCASSTHHRSGHSVISLFSKSDCRPTLRDHNPETFLRALAPRSRERGQTVTMPSPLIVRRVEGLATAPELNLQALKPRSFGTIYNALPAALPSKPTVVLGQELPRLESWTLPDWASSPRTSAYLLFHNGFLRCTVRRGQCFSQGVSGEMVRLDTLSSELESLFVSGAFPAPCLVLLRPWDDSIERLSLELDDFQQQGFAVEFIPLRQEIQPGPVRIPSELVQVRSAGQFGRLMEQDGQWQGILLRQESQIIEFDAIMPPWVSGMDVTDMVVALEVSNPGENVRFDAAIAVGDSSSLPASRRASQWQQALKPSEQTHSLWTFTNLAATNAVDPFTGRCRILLRATQKRMIDSVIESQRANAWRITSLRVSATGNLSDDTGARKF